MVGYARTSGNDMRGEHCRKYEARDQEDIGKGLVAAWDELSLVAEQSWERTHGSSGLLAQSPGWAGIA
jgi:hypothetical protein